MHNCILFAVTLIAGVTAQQVSVTGQPQARATSSDLLVKHLGGSSYGTRFPGVTWDENAWTLTSTSSANDDWHAQSFVANGYIGSSFASTGPFPYFFPNSSGWPLFDERITFGTVAGFFDRQAKTNGSNFPWLYQYGWDSAISGLPSWGPLVLDLGNGTYLDSSVNENELSQVTLVQDFKRGLASYAYKWAPASLGGKCIDILYTVFADKLHPNRAYVQLNATADTAINATIVSVLDGSTALRTNPAGKGTDGSAIFTAVMPMGVDNVTAWIFASLDGRGVNTSSLSEASNQPYITGNESTIAQSLPVNLQPGNTVSVTKFVGIASTDAFTDPRSQAKDEMSAGMEQGFNAALDSHVQEWNIVLSKESVVDFSNPATSVIPSDLIERQITGIVAASMLLMNTVGENAMSHVDQAPINVWGISVCGLTSDCYAGQRFWDEDIWMQPYLAAAHSFEAKQISLSRTSLYPQALANAQTSYQSSKNNTMFSSNAAAYPWTSGRDGNCTATGPCFDYEYHLNGDIVNSFVNYWSASGDDDFFNSSLLEVTNSIATFYSELLTYNETTSTWWLTNLTDPDEYANGVDNGGFTMALIRATLRNANYFNALYNQSQNSMWEQQAATIEIPADYEDDLTLEYTGMNGSISVKQADVILRTYPLNDNTNYTVANQNSDLDYYAAKQSQDGPGMTYAIFSIDASILSPSGCSAHTYDLNSWSPYIRAPWFTFSEQLIDTYAVNGGTNPAYPFLTGFGGFLQVDLMGYLGLRYGPSYTLSISPNLPPQIPYIRFPTFYFQGWPISAHANQTHFTLTRLPTSLSTANKTFATLPFTVQVGLAASNTTTYTIAPNSSLVIPNNPSAANATVTNNILQCRPLAASEGPVVPGQFALAAIDGATSTVWQAASTNTTNSLTIDLTDAAFAEVDHIYINWGMAPAASFSVIFHNGSSYGEAPDGTGLQRIDVRGVEISEPYDAFKASLVAPYVGNATNVSLSGQGVWTGRYATLVVEGNLGDETGDALGASVAEWAVVVR